ncbi:TPA: SagB/ThcOx family dehydrogenase [Clostridium botulinum]|nr:SagB/ThcOx family dehydrogenase [Clostridium botulinum]
MEEIKDKENVRVVWSPAVRWSIDNEDLKIQVFRYKGSESRLFPEFYYETQKGIYIKDLLKAFPKFDRNILKQFILDLIKKRVLVDSPLKVKELFYTQNSLFQNKYPQSIRYDSDELNRFKIEQLSRNYYIDAYKINLKDRECGISEIENRKSWRSFDVTKQITFESFSILMGTFKQKQCNNQISYYYASAGGLYPIDVYVYIKKSRIENIEEGLYYYSPIDNTLKLINHVEQIPTDIHFFNNQQIFEESAATIFFIYNAEVTMPKYQGMAYEYALIDTGIMVETINIIGEKLGIGFCSIGDMNFEKIEHMFKLQKNQIHLHTLELGLKNV